MRASLNDQTWGMAKPEDETATEAANGVINDIIMVDNPNLASVLAVFMEDHIKRSFANKAPRVQNGTWQWNLLRIGWAMEQAGITELWRSQRQCKPEVVSSGVLLAFLH